MDFLNKTLEQAKALQQNAADAAHKGYEQAQPLVREGIARARPLVREGIERAQPLVREGVARAQEQLSIVADQAKKAADATVSAARSAMKGPEPPKEP